MFQIFIDIFSPISIVQITICDQLNLSKHACYFICPFIFAYPFRYAIASFFIQDILKIGKLVHMIAKLISNSFKVSNWKTLYPTGNFQRVHLLTLNPASQERIR
mgnify:CR=1 FL=1